MAASNWDNEECSNEQIEEGRIGEDEMNTDSSLFLKMSCCDNPFGGSVRKNKKQR